MLTKFFFTLAVVALVVALVRFRGRPARAPVPSAAPAPTARRTARTLAVVMVVVMGLATAVTLYLQWRDRHQVLEVAVIDAGSGRVSHYRVRRGQLGERSFVTLDGRRVQLAETDRLEVAGEP